MSAQKKAKKRQNAEENMEDSGSDSETEQIMVDFEAFPPTDGDVMGIKALLANTLPGCSVNMTEVGDLIVDQTPLGCVVKTAAEEGEEDIYGVFSVLSLDKEKECIGKIREHLEAKLGQKLKGEGVGWIVSERMVNIPFQLAVPALDSLRQDMKKAGAAFNFSQYVMILKVLVPKGGQGDGTEMFMYPEEELLSEVCEVQRDWEVGGSVIEGDESFRCLRRVTLFTPEVLDKFLTSVRAHIPQE